MIVLEIPLEDDDLKQIKLFNSELYQRLYIQMKQKWDESKQKHYSIVRLNNE